jgi:predicted ATPase
LLQGLLLAPAASQPLCVLVEDAQWLDPTTQELLNLVIDRLVDHRVLMLITLRPEFTPPWGTRAHLTHLAMNRLSARACAGLIVDLAHGKTLPDEVLRQIIAKADGVPLFVEALTKAVLESGLLREDTDAWRLDGPLPPLAIPSSLHDSFMARLDRMAPVKEVAQVGAAIVREFSSRLLGPVLDMSAPTLDGALMQLVEGGLLVSRGGEMYAFKHALTRDAAYASLLKSRRQICHQRIATVLEEFDDGFGPRDGAGVVGPSLPGGRGFQRRAYPLDRGGRCRRATRRQRGSGGALPLRTEIDGGRAATGRRPGPRRRSPVEIGQCPGANGRLPLRRGAAVVPAVT